MSCASTKKSCYDKSCERFYNNNPQPFLAGATLQLQIAGAKVVDSGTAIETEPLSYTTLKTGLYHIAGDIVVDATTAGNVTYQVYMDGVPLPCTLKSVTLAEGNTAIHTETDLRLSGCCWNVEHSFTFVLTSATAVGSVIEFCSGITKIS